MSIATSQLAYPVITISAKGFLDVRRDEDTLTTASTRELRIGWFDDMTIVDSDGRAVKTKGARFVSGKGTFRGYYGMFLGRIVRIELLFDEAVVEMPFDKIKKKVLREMRQWGQAADPDYTREELRKLCESRTTRELIELYLPHNDAKEFYESLKPSLRQP